MDKQTVKPKQKTPEPDSIAWYLERGDHEGALRKLAEVRGWLADMRVELERMTA